MLIKGNWRRHGSEVVIRWCQRFFSRRFATRLRNFAAQFCRPQRGEKTHWHPGYCVASCKKKFTCNTPVCNCSCCVGSCKESRTTLYFSPRCETSCMRVTPPLQLERFLFVIVALQVARKIASCNMALTFYSFNCPKILLHGCSFSEG